MAADDYPNAVSTWSDLSALVEHFSFYSGHAWLFRGVKNANHPLVPKVGREHARAMKHDLSTLKIQRLRHTLDDERAVFSMFKQQARAYHGGDHTELEWLAIAQHHGLPTRLLDWTDSFLIAAWFAVSEPREPAACAIWVTRGVPAIDMDYTADVFTLAEPHSYRPPHINPRIAAQSSVFMICPEPSAELKLPLTKKITISRHVKFSLEKRLNACGINRRLLFPDLSGLSDHLALMYRHDWLAGYRDDRVSDEPSSPDDDAQADGS